MRMTRSERKAGSRFIGLIFSLTALALTGACSSISVESDWDTEVDFSGFETFALIDNPESKVNRLVRDRIRNAIGADLSGKGLQQVANESEADLAVGYELTTEQRTSYHTIYNGWGTYGYRSRSWRYGGATVGKAQTIESNYTVGTLVIAVFRAEDKALVWEGAGSGTVSPSRNPDENTEKINEAVQKVLEDFPPNIGG